jgi:hypothetical protein
MPDIIIKEDTCLNPGHRDHDPKEQILFLVFEKVLTVYGFAYLVTFFH